MQNRLELQDTEHQADDVISLSSHNSDETTVDDLLSIDVDPSTLLSSVNSLFSLLQSTVGTITAIQDKSNDQLTQDIAAEHQILIENVEDLEQVIVRYNNMWSGSMKISPSPDPSILKWTSDCVVCVLGLQADARQLLEQEIRDENAETESWAETLVSANEDEEMEEVITLHRYLSPLQKFNEQLKAFLPIMKCDLDELETSQINFPSDNPSWSFQNSYTVLRRVLYNLKDTVRECIRLIKETMTAGSVLPEVRAELELLKEESNSTLDSLTEFLSNHGSEWIESGLAGKLSFIEFCNLNVDEMIEMTDFVLRFSNKLSPRTCEQEDCTPYSSVIGTADIEPALGRVRELNRKLKLGKNS